MIQSKNTKSGISIVILFATLILATAFFQNQFKQTPQLILIGSAAIILFLKVIKEEKISSILFYCLLALLLFGAISMVIGFLIFKTNHESLASIEGNSQKVMDMNWIWGVLLGLTLTPIILSKYHKSKGRNKKLELMFLGIFVIVSIIIYLT